VTDQRLESRVSRELCRRKLPDGGWSFFGSTQVSIEVTCLASMAMNSFAIDAVIRSIAALLRSQTPEGSWPAFVGDTEGSWVTALAISTLNIQNDPSDARERAFRWMLETRGREGHWLWKWKFKTADRQVNFDPEKYGWPWTPGANSWVIPTAFAIIALKQFTVCDRTAASENRVRRAVGMLLDRACRGGGWNAGNSIVYGVPLVPHIEPTALSLMALQDEPKTPFIQSSVEWLKVSSSGCDSIESLSWSILALFIFQEAIAELQTRLALLMASPASIANNATLALGLLALRCGKMIHPFEVLR
jgi:hypothetical protein